MGALAYYNENNDAAADWLENLIAAGMIAAGHVDRRSITEVQPDDLHGYAQHHFFAGIGGWSRACRLAGWPDARPIWTASCPCQPFSVAGKGAGEDDARHLWPDLLRLWRAFRPACGVGEQVAKKAGYGWFDGVRTGLAGEGYASRAVDIPALAVDSPHERNRLYWVTVDNSMCERDGEPGGEISARGDGPQHSDGSSITLANADCRGCDGRTEDPQRIAFERTATERVDDITPEHGFIQGLEGHGGDGDRQAGWQEQDRSVAASDDRSGSNDMAHSDPTRKFQREGRQEGVQSVGGGRYLHSHGRNRSFWSEYDWIICHDDKARRVANASAPLLVDGLRGRVAVSRPAELCPTAHPEETRWVSRIAAWSGFGNAIVPPLAAEVIGALMDSFPATPDTGGEG